jgi:hypothetical protein
MFQIWTLNAEKFNFYRGYLLYPQKWMLSMDVTGLLLNIDTFLVCIPL